MGAIDPIDFGRPMLRLRVFSGRFAQRIDLRAVGWSLAILAAALAVAGAGLLSGAYPITADDLANLIGGTADERVHMVVLEWRLPRIAAALFLGASLGASGAIFQSLTRNPLGSPDVVGFDAGAYAGALAAMLLLGAGPALVGGCAFLGGLATAACVYLLSRGTGGVGLIVIGIAVGAILASLNTWMLAGARLEVAASAAFWGAGSLNGIDTAALGATAALEAVLLAWALALSRSMRQLELGDDLACASGVRTERTRLLLVFVGVGLTALVTATAGPISFVALAAPQLARRFTGSPHLSIASAAAMGGLLLAAADYTAHHAFAPTQLPAGLITLPLGGLYFVWLLLRETGR
ncbi:FecCD family ABC transporter permease [Amorphus sp. 3PC139-8]|uniref:FecCD family ABC transporter permease n=1 Tax=Amorphus sp. 3PC139-8 TaxID=2735676 RepID=UPI00345C75EE